MYICLHYARRRSELLLQDSRASLTRVYVYGHVYVCTYACMLTCVHMSACLRVYICAQAYTHINVHAYVFTYAHKHMFHKGLVFVSIFT